MSRIIRELVDDIFSLGAAVVVFDAVFAEPDGTSPVQFLSNLSGVPISPALKGELENLPDHDAVLARAFENGRVVAGFVFSKTSFS